ncbi:MAG: hypothetical protein HW388_1165, partial [Dehalococcoidia bacterium]|nr:hypothetical protein [Dehalococcoidia bacterium]
TALSGLKIVELGGFVAAPYCTKLMADLGAEVIKVEEPDKGDPARSYGPFPKDDPHPERSLLFAYLNTNKQGITLNVKSPLGKKLFKELLRDADVLVESNPPKLMKRLGLDYKSLSGINPRLIVTSITPFGQTGPYRDYKGTDLIAMHMGGVAYTNPGGGIEDPDNHPPLKAPGHQADFMTGIAGASATMCALMSRDNSGQGEHVDISEQEIILSVARGEFDSHTNKGATPTRLATEGRPVGGRRAVRAKDGYFTIGLTHNQFWTSIKRAMGNPEWAESEIFNNPQLRNENMDACHLLLEEWSKNYTREELYQIFQVQNRVPYLQVNTMADLLTHRHYIERGTFVEMEHPQIAAFKAPGPPYNFSATPWRIEHPAPTLGQHNKDVICARLGYSEEDMVKMRQLGAI